MAAYEGKLVPPAGVMTRRLDDELRATLKERHTARILERADIDGRVERSMERRAGAIESAVAGIVEAVSAELGREPRRPWTDPVGELARRIARGRRGS
jgi:hypothetical protein